MIFSKTPITISGNGSNTFLYSPKGLFMIDNQLMVLLLKYIERNKIIRQDEIEQFWLETGGERNDIPEVIDYLTEEVQVLLKVEADFYFKKTYYISNGFIKENIINKCFSSDRIISLKDFMKLDIIDNNALYVVDMLVDVEPSEIDVIQKKIGVNSTAIFLLMVGDSFIISHAYSKGSLTPCILCLYDYIMDRIFADRTNKISSMSDVINHIKENYGVKAPGASVNELDFYYLMRELEQYLLTLTGNGRSAYTGCDVSMSKIINIHSLEKTSLCIPFSPKCDCLHNYHKYKGYRNA